jgi:hypothetical protein
MDRIDAMDEKVTDKIKAVIALHVDMAVQNPSSVTVFSNEWKHLSVDATEQFNLKYFLKLRKDYENRFRQILILGINKGELKNMNPDIALFTIITSVRWLHYWYKPSRMLDANQLIEQIASLILYGIES